MRLTLPIFRGKPPLKDVPPQQRLSLVLKDKVTSSKQGKEMACLQELNSLIACLSKNDYDNTPCSQETMSLDTCRRGAVSRQHDKSKLQKLDDITYNMKNFTNKQITNLLRKYPTI